MTEQQREQLNKRLRSFTFMDFHSFANEHNIIFDNDEWEEYSNKMKILKKKMIHVYILIQHLILP